MGNFCEAFSREEGGNRAGRHRRVVGWAERVSWAGREAEAQWGEGGGRPAEKEKKWAAAGPKGRMGRLAAGPIGPKVRKNSFLNNNLIFEYTKALEIYRSNFDMWIFPKIF
jgi:hypothetical protein